MSMPVDAGLFGGLPAAARTQLLRQAMPVQLRARAWLFHRDDAADAVYVVKSGRLEAVDDAADPPAIVRRMGPGAVLGELAVVTEAPRSLSVRAVRDSIVLRIDAKDVMALMQSSREFAAALARMIAERMRERPEAVPLDRASRTVVAVVAVGRVPAAAVAHGVAAEAARWSRTEVVTAEQLGWQPDREGDAAAALDRRERDLDHVLLLAPEPTGAWRRFCLRQGDGVVAVVDATRTPAPDDATGAGSARREHFGADDIVFVQDAQRAVTAEAWLDLLQPRAHHFVEVGAAAGTGTARAARRILGRSLGVVLSGGGTAGFAHIGVLQVLHEAGIAVDHVGGTSVGGCISAMLGAGIPVEAMSDICHREFGHGRPLGDYSIPRRALVRGERFAAILRRVLGDRRAERTSMAWFGLSADLVAAEIVIHRRGPLWRAVHAGVSIPGLLPPMADNGRLLVDGGLLNNFPVDVMAATGEGPVLGVDVMGRVALARGGGPSITDVLGRSIVLASHERAVRTARLARWVITPRVPNGGFLDFRRLHVAVAAGRAAAERALMDMPDLMDPSTPSTGDRPVPGDPTRHQEGSST